MNRIALLAAAFALGTGIALAQDALDGAVADLQAQGYTRIEARHGPTQTKIEAIKGDLKVEIVIDNTTGQVLKSETETVRPGENTAPGVFIRDRDKDFVDGSDDDDDDNSGSGDDDDDDDNSGSGDDGDDDTSGHGGGDDDQDNSGHGNGDDD
ncbi:PepSY domain-containing protein [Frigidibacter sp. SD6-1]|uniref:PepSY domain-containing protein n=1 Tax=Frigidibacter sp. SD6-1 TaxID=3032581 RepID=UPI0024E0139A|nr:PepSY domain-containing protein [Frigidibacter sp. SD6-1]